MKKLLVFLCILAICGAATLAVAGEGETRGVGYWKNHDNEREAIIVDAAALSSVFSNEQVMREYIMLKGKKNTKQHALRQLASLLLNIRAGLDAAFLLTPGEREIIQVISSPTTIAEAIAAIETAIGNDDILDPVCDGDCETVKDLAEEINSRGVFYY